MRPPNAYESLGPVHIAGMHDGERFSKEENIILTGDPILDERAIKKGVREARQARERDAEQEVSDDWQRLKDKERQHNLEMSQPANPLSLPCPKKRG